VSWIAVGAVGGALAVVAGAFGAHALGEKLGPRELGLWETASRYLMYGSLALVLVGLFAGQGARRGIEGAAWCLGLGTAVFSGTVFALALGGPRWLGAVTPVGGTLLIVGFLLFAWAAGRG
jgi:uncharacterized membrane protein YgdD (TMEM256/DUF423 family)